MAATVDGSHVEIHVSRPVAPNDSTPLVVFASGDGGWFGAAVGMFEVIAGAGYPVIGVSSRALLQIERSTGRIVSEPRLANAYRQIIDQGRRAMRLDSNPRVVLTGWSRGASISVMLGAGKAAAPVAGIVAIGLSADEDLNVDLFI